MQAADIRRLFPGLQNTVYLNTANMSVGCAPAREAYARAVERWSEGRFDWTVAERAGEDARAMFAEIVGATAGEIAIVPAVSTAAGIVAANLPSAKHGENVVVAENEFASNYYPWLLLRERGYEVRTVAPRGDGVSAEEFSRAADGGTRLIAVSAVNSANGYRANLKAIGRVATNSGAWFFVDACQAAGAVPLDVVRDGVDFLAAASHKFLLGSRGMGYLYVRRDLLDRLQAVGPGWKAARKPAESFYGPAMDLSPTASKLDSSLAWFPAMADQAALNIFRRYGTSELLERNSQLVLRLRNALTVQGLSFQPVADENRSTIVSVQVADTEAVLARFRQANVLASVRAGRIRLAVHFYNLEEELDRVAGLIGGS
ncbi:aminotransferase class V-fold PLP-dependent enzyme [Pseudarthrobacter psychrotolerans]|uniref:Aminotransferase class V-fold PLP-dependent enzyme n=1 Tax=Pseudarthrobacter psychrotolerans TaxID=2697569 RepID=A0A6P1NTA8_9MICC|nr:aminotransferase class V-fold PLP-dependent enzyme [Pseudarthrobacter psychrotolerans]QHK21600.1 aminotransferase class V-fold PLP-dependent enzyme [Pseudarthrobacter psychrotolerans]